MNDYSNIWIEILNKEMELHFIKNRYLQMDKELIINDLKQSLMDSSKLPIALGFVFDLQEEYKIACFNELVYQSVYGSPSNLGSAKEIVIDMDREWVSEHIGPIIFALIQGEIDEGYEDYLYRNIANIYFELEMKDQLTYFLNSYCKDSSNESIREIYLDYSS